MAVDFSNAVKTDEGVQVNGVVMHPIVEQCEGCERIREFEGAKFCGTYPQPAAKWRLGTCNFSTHTKTAPGKGKAKVNPLKASKRAAKGR
ncbi:hypothetical protein SAMN04488082_102232 [Desulfomicrobium apsheronum]|jgi:hypothetical protein|uniref:Uncharacterized protein n=1 Tax=Desulfomicrobium apsheronum TaxID=52560 RepID=A0A1I3Q7W4_9BACT|nr:PxxKW family cysteine-rich protein [Desulfomicrobium apsheronum]MDY0225392.1 PxxKW family cysteine-rich protein [Desulfomicrobium apsheronum]SFJ29461.1 hypothetical protein SAMN04488082_102232 [Desulfomicrobium apsheronum]